MARHRSDGTPSPPPDAGSAAARERDDATPGWAAAALGAPLADRKPPPSEAQPAATPARPAPPPHAAPVANPANARTPSMAAAATTHARMAATAQAQVRAQPDTLTAARGEAAPAAAASPAVAPAVRADDSPSADEARLAASLEAAPREAAPQVAVPLEADPPDDWPSRPYVPRRPATLFGVHVGQIITWQVAVLAVLLVPHQPQWALVTVAVVAVLLLILAGFRFHRRWLFQWLALWIRFGARHRRRAVPEDQEGAVDVLLRVVTRGGQIESLDIDGSSVAIIRHSGGVTAVLAPTPLDASLIVESAQVFLPLTELLPPSEEGEPAVSAQVVVHSVPAPRMLLDENPAATSYWSLGRGTVPCQRRCWIALQALRTLDDHDDDVLLAALTSAIRRLQRRLRKAGMRGQPLNEDEAVSDLLTLTGLESVSEAAGGAGEFVRERWRYWFVGPGREVHTTFRLLDWPDLVRPTTRTFLNWFSAVPALGTTVAVAVRRNGDELELETVVRMTLPDQASVKVATQQLNQVAARAGARLQRLDGEQAFGLAATLPLGGFLP